ncbi:C40 family peptidase [Solirubrobacter ginsenosidimutans]|uniref:C40 family peptidase n=1 Tax=Solirubrobacter ginsenosidimutans TaxID=490573 RepID=A0A9X3S537_9ACTN|nr:C40 family peptidase [Solirubrobacter ginsenosidimutans]MDA0165182.1 C40 family peptidase [Solirubrobacter ginsenosidimutans]
MPRHWRRLVPLTALIACALPRAGASAAPLPVPELPVVPVEREVDRAAQAATARALAMRSQARAAQAQEEGDVVRVAEAQIGDGYAWGGSGPDAFDCSGLTAYAYARAAGVKLPHTSQGQAALGHPVERDDIRRGDLVFFSTAGAGASHVGIATGKRTVVSATNAGVIEHATDDAYWGAHYVGARRLR